MTRALFQAIRAFKSEPFTVGEFVEKLGYAVGYTRNFLSQATREGSILHEASTGKRSKAFMINQAVVKNVILGGAQDEKQELIGALGLRARYNGEYVALRGFTVIDHDLDPYRLAERVFSSKEPEPDVVITNVGLPKKIITVEI